VFLDRQVIMIASSTLAPSFRGLSAASQASSYAKKMNRSSDTAHEHLLRVFLWRRGLRYRKNVKSLPGKPDIVFARVRVAVFCDGDFWHGRNWQRLSRKLRAGSNPTYWIQKINANRRRDRRASRLLESEGWTVIRVWETDIHHYPERAARAIEDLVHTRQRGHDAIY
jgi:DNA mismatch endonuclease (patch repair protein)